MVGKNEEQANEVEGLAQPLLRNDHLAVGTGTEGEQQQPSAVAPTPQDKSSNPDDVVVTYSARTTETASSDDNDDDNDSNDNNNGDNDSRCYDPWKNHNVRLSLALCVVAGTADSVWGSVILSAFLLALATAMGKTATGNTLVGTAEAVEGLTQLVTALPVGYLADVYGKCKMVRFGGLLMLLTIAITLWSLWDIQLHADDSIAAANRSYIILVIALGLWGVINGISYGPSQALYSDSIPKGRRSEMLTWLYTCYLLSSAVGPIVSIILILTVSSRAEDWSIHEIFPVFFVGVFLEIPAAILMFFFSEKYVVPEGDEEEEEQEVSALEESATIEPVQQQETQVLIENGEANIAEEDKDETPLNSFNERKDDTIEAPSQQQQEPAVGPTPTPTTTRTNKTGRAAIPYVLFVSSLIVSLGSGASVKYFPLFFKELGFGSAEVQGIFLIVPIFISALSFVAQEMGKRIGRIETTVLFDIVGVSLLYFMTWLSRDVGKDDETLWDEKPRQAILIVGVYLFRTGIMNCSYPLLESILMDHVPSNQRARWKSLESIASFGWTGSALVGGILSDDYSYRFTFSITATMQLCGGLLLMLIRPFVEAE